MRDKTKAKKAARKQAFYDVNQLDAGEGCMTAPTKQVVYDMSSFLQQAIDRYKEPAGPEFHNLKKAATPFYDDKIARPVEAEAEVKGKLAPIASRVLMKLLFAARMARFDLLRAVQGLASRVTKWSSDCDKALHRLMCYVQSTLHYKMSGFVGDSLDKCNLWLFADSDHAGEHDNRSASGGFLALVGPSTYFPLSAFSKKQTSTALSSTEAEVVCANVSLRSLGLPSSALWSVLLNAGGGTKQQHASLTKGKAIDLSKVPDAEVSRIKTTGHHHLPDGRRVQVHTGVSNVPEPTDLTSHPLRDVWVQNKGKWTRIEEAVAWEELHNISYAVHCDSLVCIYRRSAMDYRRFAEAEADLHKELAGIRDPGGADIEALAPKTRSKDIGLIACMPHAIEPIILEDNQATIRILESGKSPAFRHADKTQRINLGWIAEQFRRRHYKMAYINTMLQAADILTKPFTNLDKWSKALELMRIGQDKVKTRKASAAAQPPMGALTRPDAKPKMLVVEVALDGVSFMKSVDKEKHPSVDWVTMRGFRDVNSVLKRKDALNVARKFHKAGSAILVWVRIPPSSQTCQSAFTVLADGMSCSDVNKKAFNKAWASFVDVSTGFDAIGTSYAIMADKDCAFYAHERVQKWLRLHKLNERTFDACGVNYSGPDGLLARVPIKLSTSVRHITSAFASLQCRDRDNHKNCRSSDLPYHLQISEKLLEGFREHCMSLQVPNSAAVVAVRSRAFQHSALFRSRLACAMTSFNFGPNVQEIEQSDAQQDPDRLADALAGLTKSAAFRDISKFVKEPTESDDHQALFLRCIPVYEWLDLRKEHPDERWTTLYEMWHAEKGVKVTDDHTATGALVQDASLEGWLSILVDFLRDMAVIGWSTRASSAYDSSRMYDLCHRFTLLTEGLGRYRLFPLSVRLLGGLFTPSLERIPTPPNERSFAIIVGDSSLAVVQFQGQRVATKRTFDAELQTALRNDIRNTGSEVAMLWGQGLDQIYNRIIALLRKHEPRHPEGFDIYISWTGNDVYGKWGYKAFTWHHQSPWVKETAEMARKAFEWPIKQLKKVQADVDRVAALTDRPGVKSVTLIHGPQNGFLYGLPEEYDEEMTRHAKVMAASGVKLVDPNPLLLGATDRPDKLHTSLTEDNMSNTVMWYRALVSGTITDRMITDLRPEFVANRREVVFYEHFHLNKPDSRLTVPGSMDLRVKPTPGLEVPPEVRDDDEQIVLTVPRSHFLHRFKTCS